MNKAVIEQYLGKYVEIMLMPDAHKTSGLLARCEEDFFSLRNDAGEAVYVYPMVWGINPVAGQAVVPSAEIQVQAQEQEKPHEPDATPIFLDDMEDCYDDIDAKAGTFILNVDYVRKFRRDRMDKVQTGLESILSRYSNAVKVHEDRPYSMRMRQILDDAKNLWRGNKSNIAAAEIYGFMLYLMGENAKSVKIYMSIHDYRAAFTASTSAASRMLAAACLIISSPFNTTNFSSVIKLEPSQIISILKWLLGASVLKQENSDAYREFCFKCISAVSWKLLNFSPDLFPDKHTLYSQANIDALKTWLDSKPSDDNLIADAMRLTDKASTTIKPEPEIHRSIDWKTQRFEGDFTYFNPNRDKLYGFISCPFLKKFNVPLRSEGSVFVHLNQIEDKALRRKLLTCGRMKPMYRVTFRLGNNVEGPAAYDVKEKTEAPSALSVDMMSALSEEGEIEFFMRYNDPPFGKVRAKDSTLYSFNERNITDPALAVFLEVEPSAEGHPVRFTRSFMDGDRVQIQNVESAVPFPAEKLKAWETLIAKAKERLSLSRTPRRNDNEAEPEIPAETTPEIDMLINRGYVPLDPYTPSTKGQNHSSVTAAEILPKKASIPETFRELPKFLQDKIVSLSTNGKSETEYLSDKYYARGHYRDVKANYLAMVGRFNSEADNLSNAERAERCFIMARYVYNFFSLADESEKKQYPASEEDNIRIMAYKGLEYLLYSQLDGASRSEGNYDTARRYCLLKLADEIQETRKIDANNEWLRIYICSYFVNGLRLSVQSGKWSAQNVSLSGSNLHEFNSFDKFFEGLLTLAYVTGAELVMPTLKSMLRSLEYSGRLLSKLGLDSSVFSHDNADAEIRASFQKSLDGYDNRKDALIQDAEVKLSPELLRILSVQKKIVRLMKRELVRILEATPETLDDALKRANPILASEEYANSLAKTKRKYDSEATLLDVLPITVLGAVMRQYWNECFGEYFGGKPYATYWKDKFAKLQWVRDPVSHAHPEYIKDEDIDEAKSACLEIEECLSEKQ